jgi:hypothetical protein
MKAYLGCGCIDSRLFDLGTCWRWVVSFTPRPFYPPATLPSGKEPRYPLDRRLSGPQNWSGRHREKKILVPTITRTPTPRSSNRSQSVYRLFYPGSPTDLCLNSPMCLDVVVYKYKDKLRVGSAAKQETSQPEFIVHVILVSKIVNIIVTWNKIKWASVKGKRVNSETQNSRQSVSTLTVAKT